MRKLNTLNEEINRMKSLFGESRLYGNLVVESYLDDISKKKEEILKILSDWESFNSGRSGLGSGVLKNEIGPLIDDAQEKITKINPNDACNEENIKLLNDNLKSIEENKKDSKYKLLPKTDKDYLNDLETKLKEIKKLCSENVTVKPNKEQPQEKKTSNNEVPTKRMKCAEVEGYRYIEGDLNVKNGGIPKDYTGLVKYCENGNAVGVWEVKDGKKDGVSRWWYYGSGISFEGTYKEGKEEGKHKHWENGYLEREENYKDGRIIDDEVIWYRTKYGNEGTKEKTKYYKNGILDKIIYYGRDGVEWKTEYYINDEKVSKKEYENIDSVVKLPIKKTTLIGKDKNDNIEIKKDSEKPITPTGSGDIIGVNYRTGKKTIDGVLKKVKDKDGETTFIIKNRKVPILNPRRNGFIDDDAKIGVMDALKNIGIDMTNKTINVINDRKFTIK